MLIRIAVTRLAVVIALLGMPLWLATGQAAQDAPSHIPTVTRLVQQFTILEDALTTALVKRDDTRLQNLLSVDFEQRGAALPGSPTPRAEWLRNMRAMTSHAALIEQMAVHSQGNAQIVSFLWRIDAGKKSEHAVFVVDVWEQHNSTWQLSTRYAAPVGAHNRIVPGTANDGPMIEKKY